MMFLRRLAWLGFSVTVAIPPLLVAWLIRTYGVDVPIGDEWRLSLMFAGSSFLPSWRELMRQANDSVVMVPKLLWVVMGRVDHWDLVREMWLTLGAIVAAGVLLGWVWHRTIARGTPWRLLPLVLVSLILFTPAQHDNLLWGIQLVVYLPPLALVASIALALSAVRLRTVLACSALLGIVATFSYANGLLVWLLSLPTLIWFRRGSHRREWMPWSGWATCACGAVWQYFRVLKPTSADDPTLVHGAVPGLGQLDGAGVAAKAYLSYVGSSLSYADSQFSLADKFQRSIVIGAVVLALIALAAGALLLWRRTAPVLDALVVWGTLATYGMASGVLIVLGRLTYGPEYMLSSRYIGFSAPIVIAALALTTLALAEAAAAGTARARLAGAVGAVLACGFAVLGVRGALDASVVIRDVYRLRLHAKSALIFLDLASDEQLVSLNWSGGGIVRRRAPMLYRRGALLDVRSLTSYHSEDEGDVAVRGCIEGVEQGPDGRGHLTGWAFLADRSRPADGVLITGEAAGRPQPIALAIPAIARSDVYGALENTDALWTGWDVVAPSADGLRAWAYDAERNAAFPLPASCRRH